MREGKRKSTLIGWLMAGVFGAAVLAAGAAAVTALNARAADGDETTLRPPLTVATVPLTVVGQFDVRESFVGQIEPARQTSPAAERAGLITEVLVEEGQKVTQGQVLARLDIRPLVIERSRLQAERDSIAADIDVAKLTADRRARLVDDGWSSRQAHDEARFSVTALEARQAAVDATIARIDLDLEKSVIRSPFAGEIAARLVDEGTVIAAGTALFRLQETMRPQARIGIPADRAGALSPGMTVKLTYRGDQIDGRVASVTREMQSGTRTIPVLIDLDPDPKLVIGQVVRLRLDRTVMEQGAWVALSALSEAERGLWSVQTVVAAADGHIVQRELVEILHVDGERAFVRGTFSDGTRIVAAGGHRLSVGQSVAIRAEGS